MMNDNEETMKQIKQDADQEREEIEKKNQNIRDDILEMNGLNPSWTRQNSGKYSMAAMSGPVVSSLDE